jgi:ppGpp synthetase/RelA/SpoT-type nucleotidyltranferase
MLDLLAQSIQQQVVDQMNRLGLLSRVFARAKTKVSLEQKLNRQPGKYSAGAKLIQDAIGVRVIVYFGDDIDMAKHVLEKHFQLVETVRDEPDPNEFGPTRLNLVFRLPGDQAPCIAGHYGIDCIDDTFEVQIRTILSEGWHEIEHDQRYKHKNDWDDFPDLSRTLNGIVATLETCDWSMIKIFDELAYRNYRQQAWPQMIRNKFRLRFDDQLLSAEIQHLLDSDPQVAKRLFQSDRRRILLSLAASDIRLPLTLDNMCFLANRFALDHEALTELADPIIRDLLNA